MLRRPPIPILFPYTTLFRSGVDDLHRHLSHEPDGLSGNDQDVVAFRHLVESAPVPTRVSRSPDLDRKSTRLNSSHLVISYAVFCLKKKNKNDKTIKIHAQLY